jgi:hypothetical protein
MMLVSSMWQTKVKFAFAIFLLLAGLWCRGVLQDQQFFRAEVMARLRELENWVGGAEEASEGLKKYERFEEEKFVE